MWSNSKPVKTGGIRISTLLQPLFHATLTHFPPTPPSAVHNLAVALHTLAPDEASLLSYLSRAKNVIGQPLYDTRHALRLATERGKHRACVKLLCGLGELRIQQKGGSEEGRSKEKL